MQERSKTDQNEMKKTNFSVLKSHYDVLVRDNLELRSIVKQLQKEVGKKNGSESDIKDVLGIVSELKKIEDNKLNNKADLEVYAYYQRKQKEHHLERNQYAPNHQYLLGKRGANEWNEMTGRENNYFASRQK